MKTRHARKLRGLIQAARDDYWGAGYPRQGWKASHPAYFRTWSNLAFRARITLALLRNLR